MGRIEVREKDTSAEVEGGSVQGAKAQRSLPELLPQRVAQRSLVQRPPRSRLQGHRRASRAHPPALPPQLQLQRLSTNNSIESLHAHCGCIIFPYNGQSGPLVVEEERMSRAESRGLCLSRAMMDVGSLRGGGAEPGRGSRTRWRSR